MSVLNMESLPRVIVLMLTNNFPEAIICWSSSPSESVLTGNGLKGNGACSSKIKKTGPLGGHEAATYFLFSLTYLLSRSVAVSLIASQVNTASSVPAPILYEVPSPVYCIEVQRFLDQVNGDQVALSGLQFFNITRGLLLTVAGTIVTYELVMVQFNSPQPTTPNSTLPTFLNLSATTYLNSSALTQSL